MEERRRDEKEARELFLMTIILYIIMISLLTIKEVAK